MKAGYIIEQSVKRDKPLFIFIQNYPTLNEVCSVDWDGKYEDIEDSIRDKYTVGVWRVNYKHK